MFTKIARLQIHKIFQLMNYISVSSDKNMERNQTVFGSYLWVSFSQKSVCRILSYIWEDIIFTIIDNIFSNVCNVDTKSGNILTQIADHFPQFLIVRKAAFTNKTLSYYQHEYSKFDQEKFLADFNNLDFEYLNERQNDVNAKFNRFLASLDEIVKEHAPLKKLTRN